MTRPAELAADRGIDSAQASLERARALGASDTIASIAVSVPVVSAAVLAEAFSADLRFLWRDRRGALHGSVGVTAEVTGRGRGRFTIARDGAAQLYRRVAGEKPPLYGGFSFEPGSADGGEWRGFGDARFELPALSYIASADRAELRVNVNGVLDPSARRAALGELEARSSTLHRLAAAGPSNISAEPSCPGENDFFADDGVGKDHYLDLVRRARQLIQQGVYGKIVVARSCLAELAAEPRLSDLLGRLERAYQDCTVFCVAGDSGTLVAASPERLATVSEGRVETAALAGTVPLVRAADLHSDRKLQLEHRVTSEAIARALRRTAGISDIEVAAPRLYRLRNLVHLETPITASVASGVHIFDVADALHPTPAVAGIPTADACAFLRDHEGMERGWYAGLVGWCNEKGEGELAVALRAGLLTGRQMRLYAGAGIVGDSDPVTEWEETALKLTALGAQLAGAPA